MLVERVFVVVITIKSRDARAWEEFCQLLMNELGTNAFMDDICSPALWTGGRDAFMLTADVTAQLETISVKCEWDIAALTESIPATIFAQCDRCSATTVMEDKYLMSMIEGRFHCVEHCV